MKYFTGDRISYYERNDRSGPPRLGTILRVREVAESRGQPPYHIRFDDGGVTDLYSLYFDPLRPDVGDRCRLIAAGDTYHPGVVEKYGGGLYTVRFDDGGLFGQRAVDLIAIADSEEKSMDHSGTSTTTISDEDEARDVMSRLITTFNRVEDRYERLRKIEAKYARLLRSLDTEGEFGVLDLPPLLIHSIKLRREANLNRMRDLALKLNDLA
jgi:hypothetical protein